MEYSAGVRGNRLDGLLGRVLNENTVKQNEV